MRVDIDVSHQFSVKYKHPPQPTERSQVVLLLLQVRFSVFLRVAAAAAEKNVTLFIHLVYNRDTKAKIIIEMVPGCQSIVFFARRKTKLHIESEVYQEPV